MPKCVIFVLAVLLFLWPVFCFAISITIDFDTATDEELRMIDTMIHQRLGVTPTVVETPSPTVVIMPNLVECTKDEAIEALQSLGLKWKAIEEPSDYILDTVFKQNFPKGKEVSQNQEVVFYVSSGPSVYTASQHIYRWYYIKGSNKDRIENDYILPTIDVLEKKLFIPMKVTLYPQYNAEWTNIGWAYITDDFDKRIPMRIDYGDNPVIQKGEPMEITLIIPLQDLDIDKPTTLTTVMTLEYTKSKKQFEWKVDQSIAW